MGNVECGAPRFALLRWGDSQLEDLTSRNVRSVVKCGRRPDRPKCPIHYVPVIVCRNRAKWIRSGAVVEELCAAGH